MVASQNTQPSQEEILYVGIDIGKHEHVAGFVSRRLLAEHKRIEHCPSLKFTQSREGFQQLLSTMQEHASLAHCRVVVEHTGHYHRALEQFIRGANIPFYTTQAFNRQRNREKTDKADALRLAHLLYQQLEFSASVGDSRQMAHDRAPVADEVLLLRALVRHRYELVHECTRRKNRLTAINDELFPEFTQVFKDPNLPTALGIRKRFPTPATIAAANLDDLRGLRIWRHPSDAKLIELQRLALETIGTTNQMRQRGLVMEQEQLIAELTQMQEHADVLEQEIERTVTSLREGQILLSIPIIGPIQAATLLAVIGNITNFRSAAALRAYLGWAPMREQTGTSFDNMRMSPRGSRLARQTLYLIVSSAVRLDNEWARLYHRLVPLKCTYDARKKRYTGKTKVIVRVAGKLIAVIYALLSKDQEARLASPPDVPPPAPIRYEPALHGAARRDQPSKE